MGKHRKRNQYNANASVFAILSTWKGTMMPLVAKNLTFWLLLCVQGGFLAADRYLGDYYSLGILPGEGWLPDIEWGAVATLTSLLSFFIVFYGSQCYNRFHDFYGHTFGIGGSCQAWVALVRTAIPEEAPDLRWNLARYILASMSLQYALAHAKSTAPRGTLSDNDWQVLQDRHLLSKAEIALIRDYRGNKPFLPIIWALEEIERAIGKGGAYPTEDGHLLSNFRDVAFGLRGHCGEIQNWLQQPVPYPYFHVLTLLLLVDLLLFGYGIVVMRFNDALTMAIFVSFCVAILGLRQVAIVMSDPFGDDEIDFDLAAMERSGYDNAVACLADRKNITGDALPEGMANPLTATEAAVQVRVESLDRGEPEKKYVPASQPQEKADRVVPFP